MKKEVMELWVAALRSGKYKQGTGALKLKDKFCCLGVLCDLSKQGQWEFKDYTIPGQYAYTIPNRGEGEIDYLPTPVQNWAGMSTDRGYFGIKNNSLAKLNDARRSFAEIADFIEKEWEKL